MAGLDLPSTSVAWQREVAAAAAATAAAVDAADAAAAAAANQSDPPVHIGRIPTSSMNSGSKLERPEFLYLRVLWKALDTRAVDYAVLFDKPAVAMEDAQASLRSFPWYKPAVDDTHDFKKWLALGLWKKSAVNIANRKDIPRKGEENEERYKEFYQDPFKLTVAEGPISSRTRLAMKGRPQPRDPSTSSRASHPSDSESRHTQDTSSSYRPDANPRNPDEQIVNEALVRLLEGISLYDAGSNKNLEWSSARKSFSLQQGDAALGEEVVKVMTAATDGSLQRIPGPGVHPEDTTTYAILEAKPFRRNKHRIDIRMQEGAEMASWISSQPRRGHFQKLNGVYRRIIISQDLDEIYITIGEYDDEYIKYIQGQKSISQGPSRASSVAGSDGDSEPDLPLAADGEGSLSNNPPLAPQTPLPQRFRQDPTAPMAPRHGLSARSASPSASGPIAPSAAGRGIDNSRKNSSESKTSSGSIDSTNGFLIMREFKPFRIEKKEDMLSLFGILVALMREIDGQVREDEKSPLQ